MRRGRAAYFSMITRAARSRSSCEHLREGKGCGQRSEKSWWGLGGLGCRAGNVACARSSMRGYKIRPSRRSLGRPHGLDQRKQHGAGRKERVTHPWFWAKAK